MVDLNHSSVDTCQKCAINELPLIIATSLWIYVNSHRLLSPVSTYFYWLKELEFPWRLHNYTTYTGRQRRIVILAITHIATYKLSDCPHILWPSYKASSVHMATYCSVTLAPVLATDGWDLSIAFILQLEPLRPLLGYLGLVLLCFLEGCYDVCVGHLCGSVWVVGFGGSRWWQGEAGLIRDLFTKPQRWCQWHCSCLGHHRTHMHVGVHTWRSWGGGGGCSGVSHMP